MNIKAKKEYYIEDPFFYWSTYDDLDFFIKNFNSIAEEKKVYIILKKFLRTDYMDKDRFYQYLPIETLRLDAMILFFNAYPQYFQKTVVEFYQLNEDNITDKNVKEQYDLIFEQINLSININQF